VSKLTTFVAGAGVGAGLAYFLDNESGTRRRSVAKDKATKYARRGTGSVQGAAQSVGAQAQGVAAKAQQTATGGESAPDNDLTLRDKVESEIFRDADAPKGAVNVLVVNGIVELRGQLEDGTWIERLEADARKVAGVRDVRNLLHLPGETPANVAGTSGTS
jgi:osmotically-inducible protein OsmY